VGAAASGEARESARAGASEQASHLVVQNQ
jgi:hypothetical protein